jgi:preprotein translocase subunit SecA
MKDDVMGLVEEFAGKLAGKYYDDGDIDGLRKELRAQLLVDIEFSPDYFQKAGPAGIAADIVKAATEFYHRKEERLGSEMMGRLEKMTFLQVIDEKWKDHLREMDDLKEGIHLRAYGQKDPLVEYKTEGFRMFMELIDMIDTEIVTSVFRLFPAPTQELPLRMPQRGPQIMHTTHDSALGMGFQANKGPVPGAPDPSKAGKPQPIHVADKVGRNDPCPCGSGKKYKQCHGK